MPDPAPPPPTLTGRQWLILEIVRQLIPVAMAVIAIWQSNRASDVAAQAGRVAREAKAAAERPVIYRGEP